MLRSVYYVDRLSKKLYKEQIYQEGSIRFLYGESKWHRLFIKPFLVPFITRLPLISFLYGKLQNRAASKKKIVPFIMNYKIDSQEFEKTPSEFSSFNDFFTRKLNPSCRPIVPNPDIAVLPADGRYLVYPNIEESNGFIIKGKKFNLETLLQNVPLAEKYLQGSMVIARLAPCDYHRFHFPFNTYASQPSLINGYLKSVNPIATRQNVNIFTENKRFLISLETKEFSTVLFIPIGATCVGSVHWSYKPNQKYLKGDELGYFSFGASCIIMLFKPGTIQFDEDLVQASLKHLETKGCFGQSLGVSLFQNKA